MPSHDPQDPVFATVDEDEFGDVVDVGRYTTRTKLFDKFISSTIDHFWDPNNSKYLDFSKPFDMNVEWLMPKLWFPELRSAVTDRLDEGQQIQLGNEIMHWLLSGILHGEQGALKVCGQLCILFKDPAAQEFVANQAREEARHVSAFSRYIRARWDKPYPVGNAFGNLLNELIRTKDTSKKILGLELMAEGFAMGAFANIHSNTNDKLLRDMTQFLIVDESFHLKFGLIWANRTIGSLSQEKRDGLEDWAVKCFNALYLNLVSIRQRRVVYAQFGLDWRWVRDAVREMHSDIQRVPRQEEEINPLAILVKTLRKAGIVTDRTRTRFDSWLPSNSLQIQSDPKILDNMAADGLASLRKINQKKHSKVRRSRRR